MGYPWYVDKDDLPLSAYTSLVPATMVQEAHRVSATLHLFQAFIVKRCDIRVTVIGEDVFATEIHPLSEETTIDFRTDYGKLHHAPHPFPDQLREQLLALTRSYHLSYAGIDLLLTPEGEYVFLELNALGQFGWLESRTGVPLYHTLAKLLVEGEHV
jgi:glutathione synthase/RimK-type ligase-like ATP-grasp enzyme